MYREDLDNFFIHTIAHISKEFDLLKVSSNRKRILNIELKSEDVGEERIKTATKKQILS